jgi:hypothetical protein
MGEEATIERRIEANENRFVMSLANVKYLNEMLIHSFSLQIFAFQLHVLSLLSPSFSSSR